MKVCLHITSWRETDGIHFYGRLREHDSEGGTDDLWVKYLLTTKQAAVLNANDGMVGQSYAYAEGEESERFSNEQELKEVAIAMACKEWGKDVELYVSDPTKGLEDMERLV